MLRKGGSGSRGTLLFGMIFHFESLLAKYGEAMQDFVEYSGIVCLLVYLDGDESSTFEDCKGKV